MQRDQLLNEIERCDREIAATYAAPPNAPAWLTTLGIEDWEREKRMLQKELEQHRDITEDVTAQYEDACRYIGTLSDGDKLLTSWNTFMLENAPSDPDERDDWIRSGNKELQAQIHGVFNVRHYRAEEIKPRDITREAAQKQLAAMGCEFFEVATASETAGFKRHIFDAERTLDKIPVLKSLNAQGHHIYVSPWAEHNLSLVDDVKPARLDKMIREGYQPAVVVETSPGNLQCWLNHGKVLDAAHSTAAARYLTHPDRFSGDQRSADWRHLGRLAGFTNRKPQYQNATTGYYPFVKLRHAEHIVYDKAEEVIQAASEHVKLAREQQAERERLAAFHHIATRNVKTLSNFRGDPRYGNDKHREDAAYAVYASRHGVSVPDIAAQLWSRREELIAKKGGERAAGKYVEETIRKARQNFGMSR